MINYKEIISELGEEYHQGDELLNIAWKINDDENTRTAFSMKVTDYLYDVIETLDYLIREFEKLKIEEDIINDADEIEADYDEDILD